MQPLAHLPHARSLDRVAGTLKFQAPCVPVYAKKLQEIAKHGFR